MVRGIRIGILAISALAVGVVVCRASIHSTDFIADANRSHFNGFESIPFTGQIYSGGNGPYVEDTITVQQINGDASNAINVFYIFPGMQGDRVWYPNTGDHGYTQLTLAGGVDFQDVGFNYGTGGDTPNLILYELLDNGSVVSSGTQILGPGVNYLGFSGGGFDTIRLRDATGGVGGTVTDGRFQALAIDNIETQNSLVPVPESASLVIWSVLALVGLALHDRGVRPLRAGK